MKLREIPNRDLRGIAKKAGTTYGYLIQIKYGMRKPSSALAAQIEKAFGGLVTREELLWPNEYPKRAAS